MCAIFIFYCHGIYKEKISQYKERISAYRKVRFTTFRALKKKKKKKISFLREIMKDPQKGAEPVPQGGPFI